MTILAPDTGLETRRKLLLAGGELFARKGFQGATIRGICAAAGVNVAAAHYHFGGKRQLYEAVLDIADQEAMGRQPLQSEQDGDAVVIPEERLHLFIRATLLRMFTKGSHAWHMQLIAREMAEPTEMFENYIKRSIVPRNAQLREIIAVFMGLDPDDQEVRLCAHCVVFQCRSFFLSRRVLRHLSPELRLDKGDIDLLVTHIYRFSLAAVRNYRDTPPLPATSGSAS